MCFNILPSLSMTSLYMHDIFVLCTCIIYPFYKCLSVCFAIFVFELCTCIIYPFYKCLSVCFAIFVFVLCTCVIFMYVLQYAVTCACAFYLSVYVPHFLPRWFFLFSTHITCIQFTVLVFIW
jgi:hypothetical protein